MFDEIQWRVPYTLLSAQLSGVIHMEDFKQLNEAATQMIDLEGDESGINMIVDLSRGEGYDRDFLNLNALRTISSHHPKTRWVITIDPKPHLVARFIGVSTLKLIGLNYQIVASEAEALSFLARQTSSRV